MSLQGNPFQRRSNLRRICLGGIAVTGGTALLVSTMPAFADEDDPPSAACEVSILPGSEGTNEGWVTSVDESGTHLGGHTYDNDRFKMAAVWQDGEITDIDFDATGEEASESSVQDINADGDAVGWAYFEELANGQAFANIGDETTLLPIPDDYQAARANGINDDGVITGYVSNADNVDTPAVWETPDSEPTLLALPDEAERGQALGIDNDGQIAGFHAPERTQDTPHLWSADGEGQDLDSGELYAKANHVAGEWVAGSTELREGFKAGIRWHNGEVEEFDMALVSDINGQGDAVGDWTNQPDTNRAAKYTADGELHMLPFPDATTNSAAKGVSADGSTIAGWVTDDESSGELGYTAALWTCQE